MNKRKMLWVVIGCIMVIGVLSTSITRRFITSTQEEIEETTGETKTEEKSEIELETVVSPISPEGKTKASEEVASDNEANYYQEHLKGLDEQIKRLRNESGDSNTYSMKVLFDKELTLWSREQSAIYDTILKALSLEEKKLLEESQEAWIKDRDTKAEEAAKKFSGGTLEGVEYAASLAVSTRERTYDLLTEYMDVLSTLKR